MSPRRRINLTAAALTLAVAACICSTAAAKEPVMTPIDGGVIVGPGVRASTLGTGFGGQKDRVAFELIGRAMLGTDLTAGMGGPRGSFDFLDDDRVQLGVQLAATFGAGRYRRAKTGLLAAAEPGLFLRVLTDKIGAFQVNATWYQPLRFERDGFRGGAMASVAWLPLFRRR